MHYLPLRATRSLLNAYVMQRKLEDKNTTLGPILHPNTSIIDQIWYVNLRFVFHLNRAKNGPVLVHNLTIIKDSRSWILPPNLNLCLDIDSNKILGISNAPLSLTFVMLWPLLWPLPELSPSILWPCDQDSHQISYSSFLPIADPNRITRNIW